MSDGVNEGVRREATDLLLAMGERGDSTDPRLDPLVYEEVRRLAQRLMRREHPSHTLQPTALANEAYARLIDSDRVTTQDKGHFLALAARSMRRILVDHARRRNAAKRGGGWDQVTLSDITSNATSPLDLLQLDEALGMLADLDDRKAKVVELRFFAGLSLVEVADTLGTSEATVRADWFVARAWLAARLQPPE
jgi:RNA polymerase sigma-70 factor (ECF subfamily)